MPSSRFSFSWSPEGTSGPRGQAPDPAAAAPTTSLHERLLVVCDDRAASAEEVVVETSRTVFEWILSRPEDWSWEQAGVEIETELALWIQEQAWRGPCALWLDSLRRTWQWGAGFADFSRPRPRAGPVEVLAEELGLWAFEHEASSEKTAREPGAEPAPRREIAPWNGEPLADGRRLPARHDVARHAATELEADEIVLVVGYSETIACALEEAHHAGKRPGVWIAESLPYLDGRRMARRLARAGLTVHLGYDSALLAAVPRADRVWLPTEAIGAHAFLARIGTRVLIEEAERREVPVTILATSDKLVPGGELSLPAWCARDTWLLWDEAPEGIHLESQAFETVPIDLPGRFWTEIGLETAAGLHLRALRVEAAEPCTRLVRGDVVSGADTLRPIAPVAPVASDAPQLSQDARRETGVDARSEARSTAKNTFEDERS